MRDYRAALYRVSEVLQLMGETDEAKGFQKLARKIADGEDSLMVLQAVAAGCIRRMAEKLEKRPCGESVLPPELQSLVRENSQKKLPSGRE